MHTGYDNFWMHNHNRLKHVLNLPKNDNCSYAQLTDNYKQMQSGGDHSNLNNFIPSQNIAASSNESDSYRKSYDQSMWPPSIYPLPFTSSYVNNVQSQESFIARTNNMVYLTPNSRAQEKCDFRHLEISNNNVIAEAPPPYNTNINYRGSFAQSQINKNITAQLPRIRVKDVFSLNSTIPLSNEHQHSHMRSDGNLFQINREERLGQSFNLASTHYGRTLGSRSQTNYINYEKGSLAHQPLLYEERASEFSCLRNGEKFLQRSGPFQQHRDSFSSKNFDFDGSQQVECSLPLETFQRTTSNSLLKELLKNDTTGEAEIENCQRNASNAVSGHGGVKNNQKSNLRELNHADSSRSHGPNECSDLRDVTITCRNLQENSLKVNEANLLGRDIVRRTSTENAFPAKGPLPNEINNQENCLIKITVPHTGETSFVSLENTDRSSILTVRNVLENKEKLCDSHRKPPPCNRINSDQNGVSTSLLPEVGHFGASNNVDLFSGESPRDLLSGTHENRVPAIGVNLTSQSNLGPDGQGQLGQDQRSALRNEENNFFPNSDTASKNAQRVPSMTISIEEKIIPKEEIILNDTACTSLPFKQENYDARMVKDSQQCGQNTLGEKVINWTIKTEEKFENFTVQEQEPEAEPLENSITLPAEVENKVENLVSETNSECLKSKVISITNSKDCIHQMQTSKINLSKKGDGLMCQKKNQGKKKGMSKAREHNVPKRNYKSNINRDKLDLLIQFLEKDEEFSEDKAREKNEHLMSSETKSDDNTLKKEIISSHNRRKLSKTNIVRNKNNSREMISLMSLKGSNSMPKALQVTKPTKKLEKTVERKSTFVKDELKAGESVDFSKTLEKCNNTDREEEAKRSDSSEPEPNNENTGSGKFQKSSVKFSSEGKCSPLEDKNFRNAMKAFQNFKTHFCTSCNLPSSMDSFWINVVSGELRCLNCFQKMTSKVEGKVLKSNTEDTGIVKPFRKESNAKEESLNNASDNSRVEDGEEVGLKFEGACRKSKDLQESVKEELLEVFGSRKKKVPNREDGEQNSEIERVKKETTNCISFTRRRNSSEDGIQFSQKEKSEKQKILKVEKSLCDNGFGEFPGKCCDSIKETKCLKVKRKSSSTEEDFPRRDRNPSSTKPGKSHLKSTKEQPPGERGKQEMANKTERSVCKSVTKQEEGSENHAKKERTDYSPKIRSDHQKLKMGKQLGSESIRKKTSDQGDLESQKRTEPAEQPRKRKNSDEDFCVHKVHITQDLTRREETTHPEASLSKSVEGRKEDDTWHRRKSFNCEKANGRNLAETPRKRNSSKDECLAVREPSKKETKYYSCERKRETDLSKGQVAHKRATSSEHGKSRTSDFGEPRRRNSQETDGSWRQGQNPHEGPKRKNNDTDKSRISDRSGREVKRESFVSENGKRKKSEEKEEKRISEKTTKSGSPDADSPPVNDSQFRKSGTVSIPLKERQNTKTGPTAPKEKFKVPTVT